MKIRLSKMYIDGVETTKKIFFAQYDYKSKGVLTVMDTNNQGLQRLMKVAMFTDDFPVKETNILYEPQLIWANEERFVLAGYERKQVGDKIVRFAQSWLCRISWKDEPTTQ